jgi:hypothetical protein
MRTAFTIASATILAACNMSAGAEGGKAATPHGSGTQRSFDVGAFDSVSLGGRDNVVVTVGPAASVRAEGPADQLDRLDIRLDGSELIVTRKKQSGLGFAMGHQPSVTVYVTTPMLRGAAIGGSGDMRIDKVESASFDASIGGSGNMDVASLKAGNASFAIGGSGGIKAAGTAGKASVSIAGSGDVDAGNVESDTADISIVGSGSARLKATRTAKVTIMGSGDVQVLGPAKCAVTKMGSGDVRCGS